MPYAEVKRAMEQEAQMQNAVARSSSPYRLSPREVSKASPQPDVNAARYSVPPGNSFRFAGFLLNLNILGADFRKRTSFFGP